MRLATTLALTALALTQTGCARRAEASATMPLTVSVESPVASVLPSHVGALYLRLINPSDDDDRLVSVESPSAQDAQLHDVVHTGDLVAMRPVTDGFLVPPHGTLTLARGGKHVMLFGLTPAVTRMTFTLHFERAGAVVVDAPVRSAMDEE